MQIDANWGKLMQIDANWGKLMQIDANWCKLMQIGANWCKLVQILFGHCLNRNPEREGRLHTPHDPILAFFRIFGISRNS